MQKPLDMTLVQRGARLKRSPYFEATQRHGCWGYTVYNHMFLPIGYDDLEREYEKLLNDVTVWDVSVERNTEIAGPDAFKFMSLLTPRDMNKCRVGQGSTCSSPRTMAASSTIRCCCGWRKTGSGSPLPTAT